MKKTWEWKFNKPNNIAWGVILIIAAVYILIMNLGLVPHIPVIKSLATIALLWIAIDGIRHGDFLQIFVPIAISGCLFDEELGITRITPWTIIIVAVLLGIGLNMIFKKHKYESDEVVVGSSPYEYSEDEGQFTIDNGMGNITRYLSIPNLTKGTVDNGMGNVTIYFDGTTVAPEGGKVTVDNGIGNVTLYFPNDIRTDIKYETGIGKVKINGNGCQNPELPVLEVLVDNGIGNVDIYR